MSSVDKDKEVKKEVPQIDEYDQLVKSFDRLSNDDLKKLNVLSSDVGKMIKDEDLKLFMKDPKKAQDKLTKLIGKLNMVAITKVLKYIWIGITGVDLSRVFMASTFVPKNMGLIIVKLLMIKDTIQKKAIDLANMKEWTEYEVASKKKLLRLTYLWKNEQVSKAFLQTLKHAFLAYDNYGTIDKKDDTLVALHNLVKKMLYISLVIMCSSIGEYVYEISASTLKDKEDEDASSS